MPVYSIRGIDVDFPFKAYDCQLVYMEKVIQALQEGCNALLESPTGTGKTLCLLCASLAWRKSLGDFSTRLSQGRRWSFGEKNVDVSSQSEKSDLPTIIYTSRTHSQLQQVIRELKESNYRPKMAVLGSREQMCIHEDVQKLSGRTQNKACQSICKKHACVHHNKVSDFMKNNPDLGNEPFDIEDLVNIGRMQGPCPYYVSRELHKVVDILFAPYNYLIDQGNRRSLSGIQWSNTVLIFDEAHNLEGICADAASFDLPLSTISACITEANQCVDLAVARKSIERFDDKDHDPENFAILKALLSKLHKRIEDVPIDSKELGFTRSGPYIYELLGELNITYDTANMLMDTIDQAADLLEEVATSKGKSIKEGIVLRLESIRDILHIVFRDGSKSHANYYNVHVQEIQTKPTDIFKGKTSRTLSWWCFNPGIAMEEFVKLHVRSVILTSGTLSPLDSFALELNLDFPVRLENPHVISSDQVWVGVVSSGPSRCPFNSSYQNRDTLAYKQELGNAIVNFARIVPDGLLVFFPSYYLMDRCIDFWQTMGHCGSTNTSTIWERICKNKQPVIEPKQSSLFRHSIEDFKTKLNDTSSSGAIFFAVCRGKVSEGLDFADRAGRAVIVTGIPFAMRTDPKVRLKREFLDGIAMLQKKNNKEVTLTGEEWYSQQAARAVNQAIGRVIRHRHDYGAIIFCDERFAPQNRQNQMSLWVRPYVKCYTNFGDVIFTLARFFKERSTSCLVKPDIILPSQNDPHLSILNQTQKKVIHLEDGFSQKSLSHSFSATNVSSKRSPLDVASSKRAYIDLLENVIPANRCSLSSSNLNQNKLLKHSRDLFFYNNNVQSRTAKKGSFQSLNHAVIDLSSDTSPDHDSSSDCVLVSCVSKKSKTSLQGVFNDCGTNSSHEPFNNQESTPIVKLPDSSLVPRNHGRQEPLPSSFGTSKIGNAQNVTSAMGAVVGSKDRTVKTDLFCSDSYNEKEMRGLDFLIQIKEKLSASEYQEFVHLMKSLKSKTMKIVPVLKSIAKLLSSPDRFHLLRSFNDFVPVKFQPTYEHLVASLYAAFGDGSLMNHTDLLQKASSVESEMQKLQNSYNIIDN